MLVSSRHRANPKSKNCGVGSDHGNNQSDPDCAERSGIYRYVNFIFRCVIPVCWRALVALAGIGLGAAAMIRILAALLAASFVLFSCGATGAGTNIRPSIQVTCLRILGAYS